MSKHLQTFEKTHPPKFKVAEVPLPSTRMREMAPKLYEKDGTAMVLCPWCTPTHPLLPEESSPCGTRIKITAVQTIYTEAFVAEHKLTCAKCGQGGGEMIEYKKVYAHLPDCKPDTFLLADQPHYTFLAAVVFQMKEGRLRDILEKKYGLAQKVMEIDEKGAQTNKVLGYFFLKRPGYGYPRLETP